MLFARLPEIGGARQTRVGDAAPVPGVSFLNLETDRLVPGVDHHVDVIVTLRSSPTLSVFGIVFTKAWYIADFS